MANGMGGGAYELEGDIAGALAILADAVEGEVPSVEATGGAAATGAEAATAGDAATGDAGGAGGNAGAQGGNEAGATGDQATGEPAPPAGATTDAAGGGDAGAAAQADEDKPLEIDGLSRSELADQVRKAEQRRRDAQSAMDKQRAEHAKAIEDAKAAAATEAQQQVAQQQAQWQQQQAAQQQQWQAQLAAQQQAVAAQQQAAQVPYERIKGTMQVDPANAIQWAIANNRVSDVVKAATELHGPEYGAELSGYINNVQQQLHAQQLQQLQQQAQQQAEAPAALKAGITAIVGNVVQQVGEENFAPVKERVLELVKANWGGFHAQNPDLHPAAVAQYVTTQYANAISERSTAAAGNAGPRVVPPTERVDAGNPGAAPATRQAEVKPGEDPDYDPVKEMVDAYNAHGYR